jgi:hypothetical protein
MLYNIFPFLKRLVLENRTFRGVFGENVDVVSIRVIESINPIINLYGYMTAKQPT